MVAALTIQIRGAHSDTPLWLGDGQEVTVTARVITEGNLREDAPGSWRQRLDVETEAIELDGKSRVSRVGVRLNLYSRTGSGDNGLPIRDEGLRGDPAPAGDAPADKVEPMTPLRYGQRIRFAATLNPPRNFRNPGAFDYAGYLRDKGILAIASAKYAAVEMLPGFAGSRILLWRARVHRSVLNQIHALWPERLAGLMDAIIIGEESFIDRPERVDFQRSGTYHVLVVSGMNVSILAMFTLWSLRRVGLNEVVASAVAIALIVAYAFLTDVGPPVWRAALMFAVYLATRLLYRDRAMLNALGAAALALLVFDSNALFGASFQMTFLCVILVAGVGLPTIERTIGQFSLGLRNLNALALDRVLPPRVAQFRVELRLLLSRAQRILPRRISQLLLLSGLRVTFGFLELVIISAIMQVGLAVHMAYFFHRAPR